MSKKLDSILATMTPATQKGGAHYHSNNYAINDAQPVNTHYQIERIVAEIPNYLKREIKLYLAERPKETERTLILKALKAYGFMVKEEELIDKRGK